MKSSSLITALAEISGCFAAAVLRRAPIVVEIGLALSFFAWLLPPSRRGAGRITQPAVSVYIAASLLWLWRIEGIVLTASISPVPLCLVRAGVSILYTKDLTL